jgi:hypothetical protein
MQHELIGRGVHPCLSPTGIIAAIALAMAAAHT